MTIPYIPYIVCAAIEIHLRHHAFEVTEAGLRALEDSSFDLMIVDIFMSYMRGFESIRVFHERAPASPPVAMSGYAFANLDSPAPDLLRMAFERGAARCLRKPFAPTELLTVVNECLAEARPTSLALPGQTSSEVTTPRRAIPAIGNGVAAPAHRSPRR